MNDHPEPEDTLAAVDLGSNSFHLIVARFQQGQLHVVDRLREPVRLAAGLDSRQRLQPEARERALACLERFGQRLRHLPSRNVRIVGTNTLRKAQSTGRFLREAQETVGHPIEIISGVEEARLIYLGVSHSLPEGGRRLVVDIGGGSTELIAGEGFEALTLESLYMGCVSFSERYFPGGMLSREAWRAAEIAARLELRPVKNRFRKMGWDSAAGASGTVRAIRQVLMANNWCQEGICREGLDKLRKALQQASVPITELVLPGLQEERKPVFSGGVAILCAIFDTLKIDHMRVSDGALREGLLYDALGRFQREDVRERTLNALSERYHVDQAHGQRVEDTALKLYQQVRERWKLVKDEHPWMLRWAARLHEIGLVIAHSGYQKHGAYLLANSDLPGFSRREQSLLAALVRGHRRKFPRSAFEDHGKAAQRLCILLRLAILLHRSRSPDELPEIQVNAEGMKLELVFPDDWLSQHALTGADLAREAEYLAAAKWTLAVR